VRGLRKVVDQMFVLSMAAYNLVRMRSLGQIPAVAVITVMRRKKRAPHHQKVDKSGTQLPDCEK